MPEPTKDTTASERDDQRNDSTDEKQSNGAGGADTTSSAGASNGTQTVTGEIKHAVRQAAIEALKPVAVAATTAAATYAVKKGPDLVKSQVAPRLEAAGGPQGLLDKAGGPSGLMQKAGIGKGDVAKMGAKAAGTSLVSKLKPGGDKSGGGPDPSGTGRGRRLPIQDHVDVAVPIEKVYNQWTQFEDFPKFMHRVERVEQRDDTHVMWHENIWGVRRQWEAEITEQHPDERISWKSTGGPKQVGVVTFSKLADNLTRVQVSLDFQPHGLFEKTASGTRITRRALKSDLMRFKAFIEMGYEETGSWRGEISDGELQDDQDHGGADQEQQDGYDDEQRDQRDDYDEPDEGDEGEDEQRAEEEEDFDERDAEDDERDAEDDERDAEDDGQRAEDEDEQEDAPQRSRPRRSPPPRKPSSRGAVRPRGGSSGSGRTPARARG